MILVNAKEQWGEKAIDGGFLFTSFVFSGGIHEIFKFMPSDQTSTLKDPWINLKEKK